MRPTFLSEKRKYSQKTDVLGKQRAKCLPRAQEKYISRSTFMAAYKKTPANTQRNIE
jgi:hypothetical protein